jgi:hypothetical protein
MNCTDRILLVVLATGLLAAAPVCAGGDSGGISTAKVILLPLEGPLSAREAEVSSMTWKGDNLIILPQFPDQFADEGMLGFFGVLKHEILAAVEDGSLTINPHLVYCQAPGLAGVVRGFDGLEAMGVIGDRYFMTVEAKDDTVMAGFLVTGSYDMVDDLVVMDMDRLISIPLGLNIPNVAEEAIVIDGQRVITLSEANGLNVNPEPKAKVFNIDAEFVESLPMPQIEYRVTDASALDEEGRFWVINYYYPKERVKLDPAPDPELVRFGDPGSFDPDLCIERLLELRLTADNRIVRTDRPPVNLELLPDGQCRNWEALVRLDDLGFLLMTDKYPGTLLAFVPFPLGE